VEIPHARRTDASVEIGKQVEPLRNKCAVEKLAEIARNPLVRVACRSHHYDNALNQLPVLPIGPRFQEGHELVYVHGPGKRLRWCVHIHRARLLGCYINSETSNVPAARAGVFRIP